MSFGFSISDFFTVSKLISDIVSSLKDAILEYQELLRELDCLDRALQNLDKLKVVDSSGGRSGTAPAATLDSIKCAALTCRYPLEEFLRKIKKYDNSLGVQATSACSVDATGKMRGIWRRVDWAWSKQDEIQELQSYLTIHLGVINMLLLQHGLEKLDIVSKRSEEAQQDMQKSFDHAKAMMVQIEQHARPQALAVQTNNTILNRLLSIVRSDVVVPLQALTSMVSVCTQQIYSIALEMRSSLIGPDTRWTFFQAPVKVEDALGRVFPVPSEYGFEELELIIKYRFKEGPGRVQVEAGNYELSNTKNSRQIITPTSRLGLSPGESITMATIIDQSRVSQQICPIPNCHSEMTRPFPGGGRVCCFCNIWFDESSRKRNTNEDVPDELINFLRSRPSWNRRSFGNQVRRFLDLNEYLETFKNVRCEVTPSYE